MSVDRPERPEALTLQPDTVSEELRERDHWVAWRYKWRDDEWTKFPVDASTGGAASSTDPETWTSFANALAYHERDGTDTDGVGFALEESIVAGLDLDDCRGPRHRRARSMGR